MAFNKTGDAQPIVNIYNPSGDIYVCPDCNEKLTNIPLDGGDRFICIKCEEIEEPTND